MLVANKCIKTHNVSHLTFDIEYNGCLSLLCIKCDLSVWDNLSSYWLITHGPVDHKGHMSESNNLEPAQTLEVDQPLLDTPMFSYMTCNLGKSLRPILPHQGKTTVRKNQNMAYRMDQNKDKRMNCIFWPQRRTIINRKRLARLLQCHGFHCSVPPAHFGSPCPLTLTSSKSVK